MLMTFCTLAPVGVTTKLSADDNKFYTVFFVIRLRSCFIFVTELLEMLANLNENFRQ